jgi:hypothetical protein
VVGAVRFELTTSCTRNKRASQATLRPDSGQANCLLWRENANGFWRAKGAGRGRTPANSQPRRLR